MHVLADLARDSARAQREFTALPRPDRLVLLHVLLDACFPGDVLSMQNILAAHTASSSLDILAKLPSHTALRILLLLPVRDLLACRLVSRAWCALFADNELDIWKHHVALITRHDPIPPVPPSLDTPDAWRSLYQALHFRESNWHLGLAQRICILKGHTSFVTCLKQHGHLLITGSYDETIRIWDIQSEKLQRTIRVQGSSISCLDCAPIHNLVCAGCHDVGRVLLIDMRTGNTLHKLSGHNKGIKAITINDHYVISAGMDKALVVWDWKHASKLVRFGQQTVPPIGISFIDTHRFVSVQTDGIVRTFDITLRKLVGQFTPRDLLKGHAPMKAWLDSLNANSTNVFMWLFAHDQFLSLGTRDFLLYFQWPRSANDHVDISKPPRLISYIRTNASTNDLVTGVSDPAKRRVITATRFASRTGAPSRRIYIGHFDRRVGEGQQEHNKNDQLDTHETETETEAELIPIGGAWMEHVSKSTSTSTSTSTQTTPSTPSQTPRSSASKSRLSTLLSSPSTPPSSSSSFSPSSPSSSTARNNLKPRPRYSTPSPIPQTPRSAPSRRSSSPHSSISRTSTPTTSSRHTPPPPHTPKHPSLTRSPSSNVSLRSSTSITAAAAAAEKDFSKYLDLASPNMNPMAMVCDHEKLVVGTTGGIVYSVSFVGSRFRSLTSDQHKHPQPDKDGTVDISIIQSHDSIPP